MDYMSTCRDWVAGILLPLLSLSFPLLLPAQTSQVDGRDPDWKINETFSNGYSNLWIATGAWVSVPNPDDPSQKVLFSKAEHMRNTLITRETDFKNYTVEFRERFDTDHQTYPNQNGFFAHWVDLLRVSSGAELAFADD